MPVDIHRIKQPTRDPGAAMALADVKRQLQKLNSSYGVVGVGATITGATFTTADTGARVLIQGAIGGNIGAGAGPGFYCTDNSGNLAITIRPNIGMQLISGNTSLNFISWYSSTHLDAYFNSVQSGGQVAAGFTTISSNNVDSLGLISLASGGGATNSKIQVYYNGTAVSVISDGQGNAAFKNLTATATFTVNAINASGNIATSAQLQGNTLNINSGQATVGSAGNAVFTGSVTANSYVTSSDQELKDEIEPLHRAITARLHELKPVSYKLKKDGTHHYGLIAQDVQKVMPELVVENEDGELGINMGSLVTSLLAEVQGLKRQLSAVIGETE